MKKYHSYIAACGLDELKKCRFHIYVMQQAEIE